MAFVKLLLAVLTCLLIARAASEKIACDPHWTRYGDFCYRFFGDAKAWQDAEDHCLSFCARFGQGHLASINSKEVNNFLKEMWKKYRLNSGGNMWLGATDQAKERKFLWSDGTPVTGFTEWLPGQPDNRIRYGESENCLAFRHVNGVIGWNDGACKYKLPYICKLPAAK